MTTAGEPELLADTGVDWQRRVVGRSLKSAERRSIDRSEILVRAAATLIERSNGAGFTVQEVADEAKQSLRTLYQYFESKDDLLLAVFEEAMVTYAHMVQRAIRDLDDPLERLAGAVIAATRLPDYTGTGVSGGMARLRLQLAEVEPELVSRSRAPIANLFHRLLDDAVEQAGLATIDTGSATFLVLELNTAVITSRALGNNVGAPQPSPPDLITFCLRGLGVRHDAEWLSSVDERLRLPAV